MSKVDAAPRSIHYSLAVVRQVFNFAIRHDLYYGSNPVGKVKKPSYDNRRVRFLTKEEADDLLTELRKSRRTTSRRITLISLHCGLRFGEIAGLTWGDVDFHCGDHGTLCIRNPKNGRTRFAYLTSQVRAELETFLTELDKAGVVTSKDRLVFPDRKGQRRKQMSDAFDRAVATLKLNEGIADRRQKVCFHTCRHTHASWKMQNGENIMVVKEDLGHKNLSTTERYTHFSPHHRQEAQRRFSEMLNKETDTNKGDEKAKETEKSNVELRTA